MQNNLRIYDGLDHFRDSGQLRQLSLSSYVSDFRRCDHVALWNVIGRIDPNMRKVHNLFPVSVTLLSVCAVQMANAWPLISSMPCLRFFVH